MTARLQIYETDTIRVTFDPARCIHAAECVRGLPQVFMPSEHRWVRPERASPENVLDVVSRCPTGALHAGLRVASEQLSEPADVVIRVADHGPLMVRGPVRIVGADGELILEDTRVSLCRCGHTANPPFCDGSHARARFNPAR